MKSKIIFWLVGIGVLIALLVFSLYFKMNPNPNPELKLTEDKLITNQTLIDLIVKNRISPLGNNLTEMVLQDDYAKRGIVDGDYKVAYYVCTNNEYSGWILYNKDKSSKLYGPYGWCLI